MASNRLGLRTAINRGLLHSPIIITPARLLRTAFTPTTRRSPSLLLLSSSRFYSTTPPPPPPSVTSHSTPPSSDQQQTKRKSPEEKLGLSQRLKALFRKHGWTALTVYLVFSLLDFGLTFLFIYAIGAEKVRAAEDWVLDALGWRRKDGEKGKIRRVVDEWKESHPKMVKSVSKAPKTEPVVAVAPKPETETEVGGGPVAATVAVTEDKGYSSIATTAVLAYAIHKTLLLPLRVGVTIAITPRIVRTLQGWGWNVGLAQSGVTGAAAATGAGAGAASAGGAAGAKAVKSAV